MPRFDNCSAVHANSSCAMMAGATLAVLPLLILFVFLQRFFVDSIVGSAIKG
ncbi:MULTISPECIES: hypothetical protein [unclassified Mesorhizobium]|uniref:hypothetical protein n=1 Tax=unclassified Mesorhizobium TaxID=325217 RepID=UPI001FE08327|nr:MULTISPECIES: hypothetical protein [unclassified Mesorhizobium]